MYFLVALFLFYYHFITIRLWFYSTNQLCLIHTYVSKGQNQGRGVTFGPQRGERGYKAKSQGPPNFEFLLHFYVTISKIFPILKSLRGVQSRSPMAQGERVIPPLDMYVYN